MKQILNKVNNRYYLLDEPSLYDTLPISNYVLSIDEDNKFYLQPQEEFKIPKKLYGNFNNIDRWIKAWDNTDKNMGILLTGLKGSGKTITAELFCKTINRPVIMIRDLFTENIATYLANPIFSNSVIFIDEFEKTFDDEDKVNQLLSLLDGTMNTHLIFLFTSNTVNKHPYLNNRLGRIKYHQFYDSITDNIIDEVIDDLLVNKSFSESIKIVLKKIGISTFDILVTLINECNLFNQDAFECSKYLNLSPEPIKYEVLEQIDGKWIHQSDTTPYYIIKNHKPVQVFRLNRDTQNLKDLEELPKHILSEHIGVDDKETLYNINEAYFDYRITFDTENSDIEFEKLNNGDILINMPYGIKFRLEKSINYLNFII